MAVISKSDSRNKATRKQPIVIPLIFAVLIHVVLLSALSNRIPTKQTEKLTPVAEITVRLEKPPIDLPVETPAEPLEASEQLAETPPVKEAQQTPIEPISKDIPSTDMPIETRSAVLDYELIREQLSELPSLKTVKPRTLGKFITNNLPDNWTRKAVSYTPGLFKAAELPTKAIVLDKWKSADGTSNTRIKLPNGNIVCSSRKQENPLDIYSMPIWMHQAC